MSSPRGVVRWAVGLALMAACLLLYSRTYQYSFVNFDDFEYVAKNSHVTSGLRPANLRWALTSVVGANWHPLTMISHMADCQIYGLRWVGGHHLTNVLLHGANSVLVMLALTALTRAFWPSAFVAAVFAMHPLRVESVAWISERKDVLCAFFWLLALWGYAHYVRGPSLGRYLLVTLALFLGLLSKPMIVTAPALFLVLDYWPLRRFPVAGARWRENLSQFGWLAVEKLPWLGLMLISSAVTFATQSRGAVHSLDSLKVGPRIENAVVSYGDYLVQFFWPAELAAFYPHPTTGLHWLQIARALLALIAVSLLAWSFRKQAPWLLVGWLWFLGTLVPAIGIVQVGGQARADRYTYVPLIGISLIVVWGAFQWAAASRFRQAVLAAAAAVWLTALAALSWQQTYYWKDTETLFRHAMRVSWPNFLACRAVGNSLSHQRNFEEAIKYYDLALKFMPNDWPSACSKGWVLYTLGDYDEASKWMRKGLFPERGRGSHHAEDDFKLGLIELKRGRPEDAVKAFRRALERRPGWPDSIPYLVQALVWSGQAPQALELLRDQAKRYPRSPLIASELAWLLATCRDHDVRNPEEALAWAERACELTFRRETRSLDARAAALAANNRYAEARTTAETALQVNEMALKNMDAEAEVWREREWLDPAFDIRPDVRLLSERIQERIDLYANYKPYRQDPTRGRF